MVDNKDKNLGEEKLTITERVMEAQTQALEVAAMTKTLGLNPQEILGGKEAKEPAESIQGQVVSSALKTLGDMQTGLIKESDKKSELLDKARANEDEARTNLYTGQIAEITAMRKEVAEQYKAVQAQNTPQAAMASLKELQAFYENMKPAKTDEIHVQPKGGISEQTTLTLEKMRYDHEKEKSVIDLKIAEMNNNFQIEMLKFNEESRRRWREYEDGQKFKQHGLQGFEDLAASIAAGIDRGRGGQPSEEEAVIEVETSKFKCQFCKSEIEVGDGVGMVTCPNPECNAEYNVKGKK